MDDIKPFLLRIPAELKGRLIQYAAERSIQTGRVVSLNEAIRTLLEQGLAGKEPAANS